MTKTIQFFTKEIIAEAKRILRDGDDYDPCEPNCIMCLCAVAKGNVDNKYNIRMSAEDFVKGMLYKEPTMLTDKAMLRAIDLIKKEAKDDKTKRD